MIDSFMELIVSNSQTVLGISVHRFYNCLCQIRKVNIISGF